MENEKLDSLLEKIHERLENEFMSKYNSWAKILTWLNKRLDTEAALVNIKLEQEDHWNYNLMCRDVLDFSKELYSNLFNTNKSLDNAQFMNEIFNKMVADRFKWLVKQKS